MKISNKIVSKFQEGGAAPAPDPSQAPAAPADQGGAPQGDPNAQGGGGEDPIMQLAQMAAQALQGQDCQMMAQVCQGFIQLTQSAQAGPGGDAGAPPADAPVYRKGGVLVKRIKK